MVERYIIALSIVGLVDAISYMVVAPSIIFYVLELGGTKEQYGVILSAFSFASFCAKPFLGNWCDRTGFKIPYIFSLSTAASGGLVYLLASLAHGNAAIAMVLTGRLLGGVGAASSALGFAYLAKVVKHEDQTKVNSLLSMLRIGGMAAGPGVNVFLDKVDFSLGFLHLDPLNSVGLVLFISNLIALASIILLLQEPPRDDTKRQESEIDPQQKPSALSLLKTCCCAEILVPILSIFGFNANFQLIETGFAPAANHALGWGPIETSAVLGSISIVIFAAMMVVFQLSSRKVTDTSLCTFGLGLSSVGYSLVYFMWVEYAPVWHFVFPMILSTVSFPFLGSPTRSLFTKAVDTKPSLAEFGGTMQAVLSMFASVAGFATPPFVARFVLRNPEQVEASPNHRELSPLALCAPLLSVATLAGLFYIQWKHKRMEVSDAGVELGDALLDADERTSLMAGGGVVSQADRQRRHSCPVSSSKRYSIHTEANRRQSACLMGLSQASTLYEHEGYDDSDDDDDDDDDES